MAFFALAALASLQPTFIDKPCADVRLAPIARCGSVNVAEDRSKPDGRSIALNVVVLKATSPAPHLPPMFDIDGGPGLAATNHVGFYATDGAAYRARRDVVIIDQRGTGGSNPLDCPELDAPERDLKPVFPVDVIAKCRTLLERGADLGRYLTHDAVADLDSVRAALGYDKIDLVGLSYGTTVALRYLGTHPDRVRAAVLMGVAPPSAMPPAGHATAGERAFGLLAEECEADPQCGPKFDLLADFDRAIASLKGRGGDPTPEIFAEKLRSMQYSPPGRRRVPFIVNAAAKGDLAPFLAAARPQGPQMQYYDGMFLSVICAEGMGLMDYAKASAAARATRFGDYRLRRQKGACGAWSVGKASADFLAPITSPAAVLMISGGLDPVTPPEWAEAAAKALPNARHVVIPASGHIFDGLSGVDTCLDPMIVGFLDSGDLKSVDSACLPRMRPPPFATGATP